jgi:hypothetical protein
MGHSQLRAEAQKTIDIMEEHGNRVLKLPAQ